jgi:hypothetical protein
MTTPTPHLALGEASALPVHRRSDRKWIKSRPESGHDRLICSNFVTGKDVSHLSCGKTARLKKTPCLLPEDEVTGTFLRVVWRDAGEERQFAFGSAVSSEVLPCRSQRCIRWLGLQPGQEGSHRRQARFCAVTALRLAFGH